MVGLGGACSGLWRGRVGVDITDGVVNCGDEKCGLMVSSWECTNDIATKNTLLAILPPSSPSSPLA